VTRGHEAQGSTGQPPPTLLELVGSEDAVVDAITEAFDATEEPT